MGGPSNVAALVVLKPVEVDTDSPDREGRLVSANGRLVAVLVRLDDPGHARVGHWYLEVGFGRLQGLRPQPFPDLEAATRWVRQHLRPKG